MRCSLFFRHSAYYMYGLVPEKMLRLVYEPFYLAIYSCSINKRRFNMCLKSENSQTRVSQKTSDGHQIVDHKVTLLIAAGAAMAANCEPCLNKVVPDLIEAGVAEADIQRAVEIGQFVKNRPAAIMKEAADVLTGTNLSKTSISEGCPAEAMKQNAA